MRFDEWLGDRMDYIDPVQYAAEYVAWEAAFDEGVKWALQQDANTLNKLGLTTEQE